jgi:hypothetical protein
MRIIASKHYVDIRALCKDYPNCDMRLLIILINAWVIGVHEGWTYSYDLLHLNQEGG